MKIPWAQPCFWGGEQQAVVQALRSSWISGGPFVDQLETEFARWHGSSYAVCSSSGTAALQMTFLSCGIKPGDEVIVPGFGFLAAANMVLAAGARPVFADIDPWSWCMAPESVARRVSGRTKAVVAVHPYGNMCDMPALRRIARSHKILLIEDAAQALFSRYQGRWAGTWGDAGCFSFQATKTITTGEGGCVLTPRKKMAETMRLFREHGMVRRKPYWHQVAGHNFRLTNLQAALGCAQLKHVPRIMAARHKISQWYHDYLNNIPGLVFQQFNRMVDPVIWSTAVALDPGIIVGGRDMVMKRLAVMGIETRPGFYPASAMPLYRAPRLPCSERVAARVLALPCAASLSQLKVRYICNCLKRIVTA